MYLMEKIGARPYQSIDEGQSVFEPLVFSPETLVAETLMPLKLCSHRQQPILLLFIYKSYQVKVQA